MEIRISEELHIKFEESDFSYEEKPGDGRMSVNYTAYKGEDSVELSNEMKVVARDVLIRFFNEALNASLKNFDNFTPMVDRDG